MTVVLFDVGGVLVELGPPPLRDEWLPPGAARDAVWADWIALHFARMDREMGLVACMDRCFTSHAIGIVKPDPAIYEHVIAALAVPAADIAFFDDNAGNVVAAREAGMIAHHVAGPEAVREAVASLGQSVDMTPRR